MALNACWSAWRRLWADRREMRPEPAYFTLLALVMWIATTWFNTTTASFPLALGVEAVVLTATIYFLRVRELALMGQILLVIAHVGWLAKFIDPLTPPPWWNPLLLLGLTLGLSHWWQKQQSIALRPAVSTVFQSIYAIAIITILHHWLGPQFTPGKLARHHQPARVDCDRLRRENTAVAAGNRRTTLPVRERLAVRHPTGAREADLVFTARAHRRTRPALVRHVELVCPPSRK
jgi:hypothetical protein